MFQHVDIRGSVLAQAAVDVDLFGTMGTCQGIVIPLAPPLSGKEWQVIVLSVAPTSEAHGRVT